jgi:AsmA family protein
LVGALVVIFFPWDMLRVPINRYVSDQLGRRFEITEKLSVRLGRTATIRADGLEFANPDWASDPYLVKAKAAEFDIKLWPLLFGRIVLPRIALFEPQVGLQIEPDGRRTWALSRDTADSSATPDIGIVTVDEGSLRYRAAQQGADIMARFTLAAEDTSSLPLRFQTSGKWKNEAFTASGRTGGALGLSRDMRESFPIEVDAQSGKTKLSAKGSVQNLSEFAGLSATFDIQGNNLDELYKLAGVVLPSTPPYKLRGQLVKQGKVWSAGQLRGVLGKSDIRGELGFDASQAVPMLTGKVQSKLLDFEDLRPVIGLPVKASVTVANPTNTKPATNAKAFTTPPTAGRKVLPTATLDLVRLKSMNADVIYSALDIRHVEQLPLDKGSVHVKLNNGVMQLEPLMLGVAGGTLAGSITVDVNVLPAAFDTRFDLRAVQLNQLFPTIQTTKTGLGKISGQVALKGRGNSMAQMLGTATGDVAVLMGKGEISNILLEFMGLDGGEVIKFFLRGDRNVAVRCAAVAFDVKQGLMDSKVIVLDTTDTVINGSGQVSLANETLDILLKPEPKDQSILSLRSPLKISGTFAAPTAGPDKLALGARAGLAIALGVVNPFLALLATIETGPGQDADCTGALAAAANSKTKAVGKPVNQ